MAGDPLLYYNDTCVPRTRNGTTCFPFCVKPACGGELFVHDDPCYCGATRHPPCSSCEQQRAECAVCGEECALDDVMCEILSPRAIIDILTTVAPRVVVYTALDPSLSDDYRARWVAVSRRRMAQTLRTANGSRKYLCVPSYSSVFILCVSK